MGPFAARTRHARTLTRASHWAEESHRFPPVEIFARSIQSQFVTLTLWGRTGTFPLSGTLLFARRTTLSRTWHPLEEKLRYLATEFRTSVRLRDICLSE